MTPIKDIQRNHTTVFSVRFGEKVNGRPAKLNNQLRITAANQGVVQAFVDTYGGTVSKWEEGWQAYIPRADLPIVVLPGQSVQQFWELYKSSVCERRCDGETELISGQACKCPVSIDERIADKNSCSPMTRLNFLCPEVPILGAGSLVTHGRIAAETLPQAVAVAEAALRRGEMVPATLRAVQKVGKGRQYVIPQIEIVGTSLNELMSGSSSSFGVLADGRASIPEVAPLPPAADATSGVEGGQLAVGPLTKNPTPVRQTTGRTVPSDASAPSAGVNATQAQRDAVIRTANRKGVSEPDLESLVLETTGKYLDEADFTVDQVNKVLDALNKKDD